LNGGFRQESGRLRRHGFRGLEKNHGNAEITLTRVILKLLIGMGLAQPHTEAAF